MIINQENEFTGWQWSFFGIIIAGGLIKEYMPVIYFTIFIGVLIIISVIALFINYTKPYSIENAVLYKTNYFAKGACVAVSQVQSVKLSGMKAVINTAGKHSFVIRFLLVNHKKDFIADIKDANPDIKVFQNQ